MRRGKYKNDQQLFSTKPYIRAVIIIFVVGLFILYFIIAGYISETRKSSYLPEGSEGLLLKSSGDFQTMELSNAWYKLKVASSGSVQVANMKGETILTSLTFFYDYDNDLNGNFLQNTSVGIINDSVITIRGLADNDVPVNISLTVCRSRPKMNVEVKTSYLNNKTVFRESMVAVFNSRISEVYLKNSEIDIRPFAREYWVDKQGVRFGKGEASALIYHTPGISSLQLQSRENMLFVNLDYFRDHPFIRIPYQEDGGGKWIDISASQYKPGDERINTFSLYFGSVPEVLPRFMPVPGGYLAGYIFTEHADNGNLRTHRAAYFGSENTIGPEDARGGFCGYQIPVTKSVFFDEFDDGLDRQSDSCENESEYLIFLDQLHALGNDLCLHTPEAGNSTRSTMEEAMMLMEERYDSRTWIDHGMYLGNTNREAYSADGLDPSTKSYAGDLWEEYNVKYFWSPAVEALRFSSPGPSLTKSLQGFKLKAFFSELWARYNFLRIYEGENSFEELIRIIHGNLPKLELNSQRPFMGHSFPTPLYWQNPTYSRQFYSWTTEYDYYGVTRQLDSANLIREKRQLEQLIEKRGVFFNHGYFVRNNERDGFLTLNEGELIINPYFDSVLKYMGQKRDEGSLLLTTVRDLLDYRIQVENVVFDYRSDGSIDIVNNNNQDIRGLALAIRSEPEFITLTGTKFCSRKVHDDTIIWFDLSAARSVNITIGPRAREDVKHISQ